MKPAAVWLSLALGLARLSGLEAQLPPEIENPQCLGIHKEPAHATLMPYADREEALAGNRQASPFARSLNGPWRFHWVPRPELRPMEFWKAGFDASAWEEISVPSNWQILGYGTPYYRNNGYTFKRDAPKVMSDPPKNWTAYLERNPVGSYRREFEVPAAWKGRRTFLTFDGVDSAFFLWINGRKVGYSVNSRNAAEFDITEFLKDGKNLVAVEVYRYCAGSYLEDQDMWRLSGIFRNVTLWSSPQVHIRDFSVKTDLDAQYRDAMVEVTAKVKNYGRTTAPAQRLKYILCQRDGKTLIQAETSVPRLAPGGEAPIRVKTAVLNPDKWTAETPSLYTSMLELEENGRTSEVLSARTGFRKIEIKGRLFLVNGVPIKLKGANRHENMPESGHAVTEAQMIRDLELLKQGNCNHVRTCHYSDDPHWYELCDEWGIWLTAEANVECHGYAGVLDREPTFEAAIVDRNRANVESFKNHPAIVMWSLGNECGDGKNFLSALRAVKAIDPTRPVHYEGFGIGKENPADVDSQMYPHPEDVESIAKDDSRTKPYYLCEYVHAMFNSMGAIGEYNDLFDKYPGLLGGAIWEWEDQGIWNRRDPKRPFLAYGGGFGEVPNDHYFIHKGVVFSDRSPKPHFPEMKRAYQWITTEPVNLAEGRVRIRNRYQFLNLDGFQGAWTLMEDGRELSRGTMSIPKLEPGNETILSLPFRVEKPKPGAEYFLNLTFTLAKDERWAKAGYEVAAAQFKLPPQAPPIEAEPSRMAPLTLTQNTQEIAVRGTGFAVTFDRASGSISHLEKDGTELLMAGGGPRLHLWRAPHQKDDMWAYPSWVNHGLTDLQCTASNVSAEQFGNSAVRVKAVITANGKANFSVIHTVEYTVYGDGSVAVDNQIKPNGPRIELARMGIRMQLDKRLDRFEYLGRGPMENYADRKRGSDVGHYGSTVREQMTPYAKPMECGNHEDIRWAALTGDGRPGLIAIAEDGFMQASALPYTDEQMTPVEYAVDLPESSATVLCLSTATLGAGSYGCGPRPLAPYLVWSDPASFSYLLRLLSPGQAPDPDLGRLARPRR